jgi:circadian clock protein KaiC
MSQQNKDVHQSDQQHVGQNAPAGAAPADEPAQDQLISTGIAGLDDVLKGGIPRGHFFLVQGEPGAGKTTLGLQFLMEGRRRGESALYVTLSESLREIEKVARSHHWSLDGLTIYEFTPTEDSLRPEDQYSAFHPSDVEYQDAMQNILHRVQQVQPSRVVIDSLSEIRLLARDSLRYRRQILALKHFFTNRNCTVLLLDDGTATEHDMQLQSIAHGVLILEKVPRDYGRTRRRIQVAKMRGSVYREGYHDYTIATGGVEVYPRLVASEHRNEVPEGYVSSGHGELDKLWGGGLDRGTSTLLLGPAGAGKSTIALSYAVTAAARGETVAMFLFEELTWVACRRGAGLAMDPTPYMQQEKIFMEQIDPAELSPGEFVQRVRDKVEQKGAKVVIIDSLNGLINAMPGEAHLPLQMHQLLAYLNQRGVLTLLVLSQTGLLGASMTSPVDLSYLADNVMLFRYFEADGRVRKALSILKKRSGMHEDTIRELQMANGSLVIGHALTSFRGVLTGVPTYVAANKTLPEGDGHLK